MKLDQEELRAINQAAQEAKKMFFPRAEHRKKVFGFEEDDKFETSALGAPIKVYTADDAKLMAYQPGQSVASLLKPTGQCFIPVTIGGTNRAMIVVVAAGGGKWEGSTFGLAPLARKWQNIEAWWPAAEGFTPQLVILPTGQGYFLTIPQISPANLTALLDFPATHIDPAVVPKPQLSPAESRLTGILETLKQSSKTEPDNKTKDHQSP